jgi:hypothetical protein
MSSTSALDASFNDFLFATVCEERNDMPLTVVSALARLDLDPWTEAAELARMPADGAARRLTALLARVVSVPAAQTDRATLAARLVMLLPKPAKAGARGEAAAILGAPTFRALRLLCMIFMASIAVSLLVQNLLPHAAAPGPPPSPATSSARR